MSDTLIIVIAVIAVLIVGFIVFRSVSGSQPGATPAEPTATADSVSDAAPPAGEDMADGFADAAEELIGDFVSVDPHPRRTAAAIAGTEPEIESAAPPTADTGGDALEKIKGLGPKIAAELRADGITRYDQIAGWSNADIEALATRIDRTNLPARAERDRWVEQAGLLASGDMAAFEERFGKIG